MYRIYDFHSSLAPKLKNAGNNFSFFGGGDSDDDDEDPYVEPNPTDYNSFFKVKVGEDNIYIEDVLVSSFLQMFYVNYLIY